MQWSKFLIKVEGTDSILYYNTLNSGVLSIDKEKERSFSFNREELQYLLENSYVYPDSTNENEKFLETFLDEWNNSTFLDLHILLTTYCNFSCPYCYESGISSRNLDNKTVDLMLIFLENYIQKNNINECHITISGGEPTINFSVSKYLFEKLLQLFIKYEISYTTSIISNGYLLSKDKIDYLLSVNLKKIQITLDGCQEIHDSRRVLKNGHRTFNKILENLDYIIDNKYIEVVNIRINYDRSNLSAVIPFIHYLKERYGTTKIRLSFGLITKTIPDATVNNYIEENAISMMDFPRIYLNLYQSAKDIGFIMPDIFSYDGFCVAKTKHGFVIEPDGKLTKCVSGIGRDEFNVGDISSGYNEQPYRLIENYKLCLDKECPYLPICHTGCRFEALISTGNQENICCRRDILEKINTELLQLNYLSQ